MPASCALGIAGAVTGDRVAMTNRDWTFSIADLRRSLGVGRLLVLNDFAALAHAIDGLQPGDARRVGGGSTVAGANVALLGPGTGLGVGGRVRTPEGTTVLVGEGGHATLAAEDEREAGLLALLRKRLGHASPKACFPVPRWRTCMPPFAPSTVARASRSMRGRSSPTPTPIRPVPRPSADSSRSSVPSPETWP